VTVLSVEALDVRHGLLQAVRDVSLSLGEGDRLALVGANGAGKTTLLRSIAGAHAATAGRVVLDGQDVTNVKAFKRVRLGIGLVPEGRRLFPNMTVEENLRVAGRTGRPGSWNLDRVFAALPVLEDLRRQRASSLSGGEQQAAAIGRTLMTNPRVLLLDEVSLGLSPIAVETVYQSLEALIHEGASIILVEQDLDRAMKVATHVVCMLEGRIVLAAEAGELTRETIVEAYFGLDRGNGAEVHA
jgi:branched-chain amino acid transport system ATP-binding protein